jgi:microcystin-dependent protein
MDPFVGEIRLLALNYPPRGWALCNGALLSISQNTALFSLLGVTYGGDGRSSFGLPNLQSRLIAGQGQGPGLQTYSMGQTGGTTTVTLSLSQMAVHTHTMPTGTVASAGTAPSPASYLSPAPGEGREPGAHLYISPIPSGTAVTMSSGQAQPAGGNQPHNNMAPYLVMNYCIALQGVFPQRP